LLPELPADLNTGHNIVATVAADELDLADRLPNASAAQEHESTLQSSYPNRKPTPAGIVILR
jgi:hypothetical protein